MISHVVVGMFCAAVVLAFNALVAQAAPFMIVGDDEKQCLTTARRSCRRRARMPY